MYLRNEIHTIVLLGKTGNGKSALGNLLLNKYFFKVSSKPESETIKSKIGINRRENIAIIDTPGLNDSNGNDQKHYENIIRFIKNKYISCFLLVFNFQDKRISSDMQELIKIYCNIFNFDIFNHMGLVFTKAFMKNKEKFDDLKSKKESEYKDYVKKIIEKFFNKKLDNELPCFFIDAVLDEIDENTSNERYNIILWAKRSSRINLNQLTIKDDLRIKYKKRETKTDYYEYPQGKYKIQNWDYYERYNKIDINNVTHYGEWHWYDNSKGRYRYKSDCLIF